MPVTNEDKTFTDERYAPSQWGSVGGLEDLTMPSGQVAQVRRPGPQGLIEAGVIHSLDALTGIVQNELIPQAEGAPKVDVQKLMKNESALASIIHTADRVVVHCVVQPKVEMTPNDVTSRKPGVIYADMVDLEDKMFIMQFAMGGTRDVATFRAESKKAVGGVDPVEEHGDTPKRAPRDK